MLKHTHGIVCQLNERNKQVLHITQEELDEVGETLGAKLLQHQIGRYADTGKQFE